MQRPFLLSFIAISYTNTVAVDSSKQPSNRMGKVVRFTGWAAHLSKAMRQTDRVASVASEKFSFSGKYDDNCLWYARPSQAAREVVNLALLRHVAWHVQDE